MSQTQTSKEDHIQAAEEFLQRYYKDDIVELVEHYPHETRSLWIDYDDLFKFDPETAGELEQEPVKIIRELETALERIDLPVDVDLSYANVRVYNLPDDAQHFPEELRARHTEEYVSIKGTLSRVTSPAPVPKECAWECNKKGHITHLPQVGQELTPPPGCEHCGSNASFRLNHSETTWEDACKIKVETPPDETAQHSGDSIIGHVKDDLVEYGGEAGLLGRAGERVTVTGILRLEEDTSDSYFDAYLDVYAIEFDQDDETVDVEEHKPEFTELANSENAVDLFAESIAPNLHATDAWDAAFEFSVAYLFGAPRIDIPNGPTYRGDLHFLIISDYAMGKSTFKEDIEAYSPKCISKSTTALSSDVGLTAAAVKDDFGEGQWTIRPGLLVRANNGHLILDEIDKGPDELTDMNDALEGQQVVDVEKAGMSATYQSRTALMALGNPAEGRFDPKRPIPDQLDIRESLLSRFDGIVTMLDTVDEEQDRQIVETFGKAFTEAQQAQYGGKDELEELDRPVPVDVGRAWIQYARENINPILEYEQFEELVEWYAEEVRRLNLHEGDDTENMPVPATIREVAATVKMAIAFARVRLREEVTQDDIKRAKRLGKSLIKQNWDGEQFNAARHVETDQKSRVETIYDRIAESDGIELEELVESVRYRESSVESTVEKLLDKGEIYEPEMNTFRTT